MFKPKFKVGDFVIILNIHEGADLEAPFRDSKDPVVKYNIGKIFKIAEVKKPAEGVRYIPRKPNGKLNRLKIGYLLEDEVRLATQVEIDSHYLRELRDS